MSNLFKSNLHNIGAVHRRVCRRPHACDLAQAARYAHHLGPLPLYAQSPLPRGKRVHLCWCCIVFRIANGPCRDRSSPSFDGPLHPPGGRTTRETVRRGMAELQEPRTSVGLGEISLALTADTHIQSAKGTGEAAGSPRQWRAPEAEQPGTATFGARFSIHASKRPFALPLSSATRSRWSRTHWRITRMSTCTLLSISISRTTPAPLLARKRS